MYDSSPVTGPNPAEWIFARMHYDLNNEFGGQRGFQRWATNYPTSDMQFVDGVHNLTRVDTKDTSKVVSADSDDLYNWPWIFVEDAGAWRISDMQTARLREYLTKGGFIMFDDTHGDAEWSNLSYIVQAIAPGKKIEDLPDDDELFHMLYDVGQRFQIPGTRYLWGGRKYTPDATTPKWRGVRDEQGRIIIAICHNSDVGDGWEYVDSSRYPEDATSLAVEAWYQLRPLRHDPLVRRPQLSIGSKRKYLSFRASEL